MSKKMYIVYGGNEPIVFCPECKSYNCVKRSMRESKLFKTITRRIICRNCGNIFNFVTDLPEKVVNTT